MAGAAASGADALSVLVLACVRHQFRRPALARLLDLEEGRLPLDSDTQQVAERFRTIVAAVPGRSDLPPQGDNEGNNVGDSLAASRDVVAVIKGIVDAAGVYGETDQEALFMRVKRAVFGYLRLEGGF